jgi:hypothetical protein
MSAGFLKLAGPELWHITPAENLASIRLLGLLRPVKMAELAEVNPRELRLRQDAVKLNLDGPRARLPNQAALLAGQGMDFLDPGVTMDQWAQVLEKRIFLWPAGQGKSFRESLGVPAATIRLKSETLLRMYGANMDLSPIVSGMARLNPARRGEWMYIPASDAEKFPKNRQRLGIVKGEDTVAEVSLRTDLSAASLSWALAAPLPTGPDPD